jgi:hypothetical protein
VLLDLDAHEVGVGQGDVAARADLVAADQVFPLDRPGVCMAVIALLDTGDAGTVEEVELYVFRFSRRVKANGDRHDAEAIRATPDRIGHDCSNNGLAGS